MTRRLSCHHRQATRRGHREGSAPTRERRGTAATAAPRSCGSPRPAPVRSSGSVSPLVHPLLWVEMLVAEPLSSPSPALCCLGQHNATSPPSMGERCWGCRTAKQSQMASHNTSPPYLGERSPHAAPRGEGG